MTLIQTIEEVRDIFKTLEHLKEDIDHSMHNSSAVMHMINSETLIVSRVNTAYQNTKRLLDELLNEQARQQSPKIADS